MFQSWPALTPAIGVFLFPETSSAAPGEGESFGSRSCLRSAQPPPPPPPRFHPDAASGSPSPGGEGWGEGGRISPILLCTLRTRPTAEGAAVFNRFRSRALSYSTRSGNCQRSSKKPAATTRLVTREEGVASRSRMAKSGSLGVWPALLPAPAAAKVNPLFSTM